MPRGPFVLKIQRELCHPKYARKVSGLSRNGPQAPAVQRLDSAIHWMFGFDSIYTLSPVVSTVEKTVLPMLAFAIDVPSVPSLVRAKIRSISSNMTCETKRNCGAALKFER